MKLATIISFEALELRLRDGRWRGVACGAAVHAHRTGRYEVQRKGYDTRYKWRPFAEEPHKPRYKYRARLKFEHVAEPFRSELLALHPERSNNPPTPAT